MVPNFSPLFLIRWISIGRLTQRSFEYKRGKSIEIILVQSRKPLNSLNRSPDRVGKRVDAVSGATRDSNVMGCRSRSHQIARPPEPQCCSTWSCDETPPEAPETTRNLSRPIPNSHASESPGNVEEHHLEKNRLDQHTRTITAREKELAIKCAGTVNPDSNRLCDSAHTKRR